jgi:hypothetical protein
LLVSIVVQARQQVFNKYSVVGKEEKTQRERCVVVLMMILED